MAYENNIISKVISELASEEVLALRMSYLGLKVRIKMKWLSRSTLPTSVRLLMTSAAGYTTMVIKVIRVHRKELPLWHWCKFQNSQVLKKLSQFQHVPVAV